MWPARRTPSLPAPAGLDRRPVPLAALPGLLALLLPPALAAQQDSTAFPVVRGAVVDARSGDPVPAVVRLLDANGAVLLTTRSDSQGRFTMRPAAPGVYGLRAELDGYRPAERTGIGLWRGDTVRVDLRLEPGPNLPADVAQDPDAEGPDAAPEPLVFGKLIDDATDLAIEAGVVYLVADDSVATTAPTRTDGTFVLWSDTGTYRLRAEALGYRTDESRELTLVPGDTIQVEFRLSAEAMVLDPLRVVARGVPASARTGLVGMDDFFDRYARYADSPYTGFMTRDSLARWEERVQSTGHMLQWATDIVRSVDPETGEVTLQGGCVPLYYLNGSRVPYEMVSTLSPGTLEAVEVYVRPSVPARLAHRAACGVVSYWSRQTPPDSIPENPILRTVGIVGILVGLLVVFGSSLW